MTLASARGAGASRPVRAAALSVVLGIALGLGAVPALAPVPVDAATPGLTIVGAATYDVLPAEGRVAVSVVLTATNNLRNTPARNFFFRTAVLTVLPGTSGFQLTGGAGRPKVSVSQQTATYTNLKIDLGANLAAGRTTTLTLAFDLRDAGGGPDRTIRISPSLVSFPAWAVAGTGSTGSTVAVRLPSGYTTTIGGGPLAGPTTDAAGHDAWSSGPIQAPLSFVADVVADRPADYVETTVPVALGAGTDSVSIRAWPDDRAWQARVGMLLQKALPALEREIGVPFPVTKPLVVHEAVISTAGGSAGVFDPTTGQIDLAHSASDGVLLRELAHAWFNGSLVADRWAAEGFAAYYAELVARELGVDPASPVPPTVPGNWAIPLNAWGPTGSVPAASESWASAASLDLARQIAQRAGPDALRAVWLAASKGIAAYQPSPGSAEPALGIPDWRGLLDLLEEHTGMSFEDLWLADVARPADVALLTDRAARRADYARSVALAGDWHLPPLVRSAMRAWQFSLARDLLVATDAVTAQRASLEHSASAAGLTLPGTLRTDFEGDAGIAATADELSAEEAVVAAIVGARAAQPTESGVGEQVIIAIGLVGVDPTNLVRRAAAELRTGDLQAAYADATEGAAAWTGAAPVGRSRIVSAVLLLLAVVLLAGLVRQRRSVRRGPTSPG
ncbi:MAG TPA: hypothetical protein VE011_12800 [Candidatus Dormibacteraeota bacterium]|nr:hypothetical protein [Candidatus Dormibacteraeota bacterium]